MFPDGRSSKQEELVADEEGTEASWEADCADLSVGELRTRWRTLTVASVRLRCGTLRIGSSISQSLREAAAAGSTAPHRRAAVVYLPPPPRTGVNK